MIRIVFSLVLLSAGLLRAQLVTFHRDVVPILQNRCQECHRPGQIAPMSLITYAETRPWARAIREAVLTKKMPPWFADPCCGSFQHDRHLSATEISILTGWVEGGALEGNPGDAPAPKKWPVDWNLPHVDAIISMPTPFAVQAKGTVEYQYFVVPAATPGTPDRWVQGIEVRPRQTAVVHHAVVYVRRPGEVIPGVNGEKGQTTADILAVYAPGSPPDIFPEGMAKLIPAGADLVFEVHYTPNGKAVEDKIQVGLMLAPQPPAKRVITLQMSSTDFLIPAGERNYKVRVSGTLPNDALLLGFFPHMHLRGTEFEYTLLGTEGASRTLLRVRPYDFHWQLAYRLNQPLPLKQGARLNWIATYDNSASNPNNPDPTVDVEYGLQSWEEMMVGFFDVAIDAGMSKEQFFVRK